MQQCKVVRQGFGVLQGVPFECSMPTTAGKAGPCCMPNVALLVFFSINRHSYDNWVSRVVLNGQDFQHQRRHPLVTRAG